MRSHILFLAGSNAHGVMRRQLSRYWLRVPSSKSELAPLVPCAGFIDASPAGRRSGDETKCQHNERILVAGLRRVSVVWCCPRSGGAAPHVRLSTVAPSKHFLTKHTVLSMLPLPPTTPEHPSRTRQQPSRPPPPPPSPPADTVLRMIPPLNTP